MSTRIADYQVGFSADTSQLKRQLDDVKKSLADAASLSTGKASIAGNLTKELVEASTAAETLRIKLINATDADTGKLDLTKFRRSIEESGKDLSWYKDQLSQLGAQGERAFLKMASAVQNAEQPTLRLSGLMSKLATTFANTIRWQVSTQALMGMTGAIQSAYHYAQDLNESLNNIRIVTGQSTSQMADFAKYANEAASRLSTTTTEYTDAALIFYQQGLDDEAVRARTDSTIRLAQVTGESVETVSSQLTAIWNNFSDGTDNLERYADVLVKLGATTASSSDEIAQGVEKFAATAETIGLSYEYSAAALATLTATTRQSADVVGTSLRTIFARFESLSLGETLEDEVTLNKYTEALKTVGVNVLDANGGLKDMNTILEETMQAWNGLDEAQQVALATTVAGVRQYTSFIALMNNQDFFRKNVETAKTAEGALQEQANIYAESWEAARDRVQAAAEDVYDSIVNEDAFIWIADKGESLLRITAKVVDGLGGMKGAITGILALVGSLFSNQIANGMMSFANSIGIARGVVQEENEKLQTEAQNLATTIDPDLLTPETAALQKQLEIQKEINAIRENAPQAILDVLEANKQIAANLEEQKVLNEQNLKSLQAQAEYQRTHLNDTITHTRGAIYNASGTRAVSSWEVVNTNADKLFSNISAITNIQKTVSQLRGLEQGTEQYRQKVEELKSSLDQMGLINQKIWNPENPEMVAHTLGILSDESDKAAISLTRIANLLERTGFSDEAQEIRQVVSTYSDLRQGIEDTEISLNQVNERIQTNTQNITSALEQAKNHALSTTEGISLLVNSLTRSAFIVTSVKNSFEQWSQVLEGNGDILSAITSILFTLGPAISLITSLTKGETAARILNTVAIKLEAKGNLEQAKAAMTAATANKSLWASMGPIMTLIGPYLATIIAIGAAIGVTVIAVKAWINEQRKEEIALENAKQKVEKLKTAYEDAKSAYDKLVSDKSNYENLLNNLSELKQGTDEFKQALEETNEAARKLLDEHPELYSKASYNTQGAIIFEQDTLQDLEKQSSYRQLIAELSKYAGQIDVLNKENTVALKEGYFEQIKKQSSFGIGPIASIYTEKQDEFLKELEKVLINNGRPEDIAKLFNERYTSPNLNKDIIEKASKELYESRKSVQTLNNTINKNNQEIDGLQSLLSDRAALAYFNENPDKYSSTQQALILKYGRDIDASVQQQLLNSVVSNEEAMTGYWSANNTSFFDSANGIWRNRETLEEIAKANLSTYQQAIQLAFEKDLIPKNLITATSNKALTQNIAKYKGMAEEEVVNWLTSLLQDSIDIFSEQENEYERISGLEELLRNEISKSGLSDELSNFILEGLSSGEFNLDNLTVDQINELQEAWSYFSLEGQKATQDFAYGIYGLGDAAVQTFNSIGEALDSFDKNAKLEKARNDIKNYISAVNSLYDALTSGEELDEEQTELFNKLKDQYKTLNEAEKYYGQDSYEFNRILREATIKENLEAIKSLVEANEVAGNTFAELIKSQEEALNIGIDALEDYFDILNKIPQDLEISFDQMRQFISAGQYEILKDATISANGQIQLSKDVAEQYILAQQEMRKKELERYADVYEAYAEAIKQFLQSLEGRSTAEKASILSSTKGYGYLSEAIAAVGSLTEDLGTTSTDTFKAISDNLYKITQQALDYNTALAGGKVEPVKQGLASPEFKLFDSGTGTGYSQEYIDSINEAFENSINEMVKQLSEQESLYRNMASIFREAAEDTNGVFSKYIEGLGDSSEEASKANGKLLDELKDILERYHEINRELKYQEQLYSNLQKKTDRLYGKSHLDNLAKEEASLEKQLALYIDTKKADVLINKANDLQALKDLGIAIEINPESGNIENYSQILKTAQAEFQAIRDEYNALEDNPEAQEAFQATVDSAEERYNAIQEALKQYEETVDLEREVMEKIADLQYELADLQLEKLTYQLKLIFDVKENEDTIAEFGKKLAESFGDYLTHGQISLDWSAQLNANNMALLDQLGTQWSSLLKMYDEATDWTDRAQIIEELQSTRDEIYSTLEALLDYIQTLEDALPNAVDAARARFDAMINQLSHSKTIYDSIKQLYELQGVTSATAEGYNRLRELSQKSLEAEVTNAQLQHEWYENAYSRLMEAEAALEQIQEDDVAYDLLKNARDALLEEYNSAQEAMLQSATSAMQIAREMFTEAIDKAKDDFSNTLSGGLGLDWLSDSYDRYIDQEERYLDIVNEEYEVNKWNRKLQEAIDNAKSADAIARLKELKDEIEVRRANNTLSEYDLEILEAKYNMTLKQIALEEAQNSATQMRLQRDAQGNWNYIYTADYDQIAEAQQAYDDAVNDYYNIAKKQVKDVTQEILDTWQECADRIAEIYQDETLTVEERERMIAEIREYYAQKIKDLEEEKNLAIQDMTEAGSQVIDDFANKYGEDMDMMTQAAENFDYYFELYLQQCEAAALDYESTIAQVAQDTGTSLDDLQKHMHEASDAADRLKQQGSQTIDAIWSKIPEIQQVTNEYTRQIGEIYELINAYKDLMAVQSREIFDPSFLGDGLRDVIRPEESTGQDEEGEDDWPVDKGTSYYGNKNNEYNGYNNSNNYLGGNNGNMFDDWFWNRNQMYAYASGGYTGNEVGARPAILHEQEYVLNKDDTKNILSAVTLARSFDSGLLSSIINSLNNNALIARDSIGSAFVMNTIPQAVDRVIQQQVVIEADFPGVSSAVEIEMAMKNLVNQAIQYTELKE